MGKIKINLVSGSVLEKPLISCFKGTNGNYIVLDNESNGSMGLPIIIISKINGTNLEKIIDPAEWGAVKENLKTIIGGTALPYLAVPETLSAPDDFFTQLTLPVASYDLLKSVYAPPAPAVVEAPAPAPAPAPVAPVAPEVPATPAIQTPSEITLSPIPNPQPATAPIETAPVVAPVPEATPAPAPAPVQAPVSAPEVVTPMAVETPVPATQAPAVEMPTPTPAPAPIEAPVVAPAPAPVTPEVPATPAPSAPAIDLPESQPAVQSAPSTDSDIAMIKETFMKSCENMFDALMKKFENKN